MMADVAAYMLFMGLHILRFFENAITWWLALPPAVTVGLAALVVLVAAGPMAGVGVLVGGGLVWMLVRPAGRTPWRAGGLRGGNDAALPAVRRGHQAEPSGNAREHGGAREGLWIDLAEALPDPLIVLEAGHTIVHANAPARATFPQARPGVPFGVVSRQPGLGGTLEEVGRSGQPRSVMLYERVPVERRLEVVIAPVRGSRREGPAFILVLRDISERERLAQMRSDFIAHASHELRTPLAALRGFIETLQGAARADHAAQERFLGIMENEAGRMSRILDDLLSLSRVEMRAHIAPTGVVEIGEVLGGVFETLAPVAKAAGVTIRLQPVDPQRKVRGDRDELVQVFVNLIQNAIKYGRSEGHVEVTVSDGLAGGEPVVRIAISDDGPGIAPIHLPRLTERFYRVDDRTSRQKGGTGLGLAIVKHILNRHGGELKIRSTVGEGSTFTVELPVWSS